MEMTICTNCGESFINSAQGATPDLCDTCWKLQSDVDFYQRHVHATYAKEGGASEREYVHKMYNRQKALDQRKVQ